MLVAFAVVWLPIMASAQQPSQQGSQSQPSQSSQMSGGAQASKGIEITSDSLLGTKVRDSQGQEIGEISRLLIDAQNGKVTSAIIRQGGTLGIGGREVSVPWDALKLQRGQNQQLVVTMERQMLEQAPASARERDRQQPPAASPPTGTNDRTTPPPQERQRQ
jgi:sporulation protein YlmC with PRC-barrel domain